jgi:hypothetical protein
MKPMKNILIPTFYAQDTNHALKIAADLHHAKRDIMLLSLSEVTDSITELLFLSSADAIDHQRKDDVLRCWREHKTMHRIAAEVKHHHQYGLSRPVLSRLLIHWEIDMIVVPYSFRVSRQHLHQFALRLFHQSGCPMMFLPDRDHSSNGIQRALFLDDGQPVPSPVVQQYAFHVIHTSMLQERGAVKDIVTRMHIDLIVKKKRNATDPYEAETGVLGLPVLMI